MDSPENHFGFGLLDWGLDLNKRRVTVLVFRPRGRRVIDFAVPLKDDVTYLSSEGISTRSQIFYNEPTGERL